MEENNMQSEETLKDALDEAQAAEEQAVEESTEDSVQNPEPKEEGIDYKSEFERVSKQLGQAEYKLDKQRQEKKKSVEEDDDDYEKPSLDVDKIREELLAESKREIAKFKEDLSKDTYENALSSITDNEDERQLIDFYYQNRINKTGFSRQDIVNDLSDARMLANKKRFEKTMGEMKQSMISQNTKNSQSSPASGGEQEMQEEIKLSPKEAKMAKLYGLTPDEIRNGINRN